MDIGRGNHGIILADDSVSRLHATLVRQRESFSATDLGSKWGTLVNGVPLVKGKACPLNDRDKLLLGDSILVIRRESWEANGQTDERALGCSRVWRETLYRLSQLATTSVHVHLEGESGSGKEVAAEYVHRKSNRRGPLVAVNSSEIERGRAESDLFGHVRGAFTGAERDRRGLLPAAQGGTLFLDEIGDLAAEVQPKLLRVLGDGSARMVGDDVARKWDVRIITATNADLRAEVKSGQFREDLWYRIGQHAVKVPSLRERPEDSFILLNRLLQEKGVGADRIEFWAELAAAIIQREWPDNVRGLQGLAEELAPIDPPYRFEKLPRSWRSLLPPIQLPEARQRMPRKQRDTDEALRDRLSGMVAAGYSRHRMQRETGISRRQLSRLLERLGIS